MTAVALDAMGGDHAPQAPVAGAVAAVRALGASVALVGDEPRLQSELERHAPLPSGLEVVHAPAAIGMDESPGAALLRKRDSSIVVAVNLVREGRAQAVVSAGNSGAVMGAAALRLGMLPGVERPAIAMLMPNVRGRVVVLDAGATVDCRPEHLRDFALMGSIFAGCLLHVDRPRVGLLSIGEEPSKGSAATKRAHELLARSPLDFVGNIEGKDVALGEVEVAVCDGFVGNVLLKTAEGYAELFVDLLKRELSRGWRGKLGAWLLRPGLRAVGHTLNYASYGGALLVGVNGVCVIAHGRSSPTAIASAIRVAKELAEQRVVERLAASFRQLQGSLVESAAADELT